MWSSLSRAADGHWSDQARVEADVAGGYKATMQTKSAISDESWVHASKYIKRYARASHWRVSSIKRHKGYVEMQLEYAPPKPRLMIGPIQQKTNG